MLSQSGRQHRSRTVPSGPQKGLCPARPSPWSGGIRDHPALLLASALARSPAHGAVITCLQIRPGCRSLSLAWGYSHRLPVRIGSCRTLLWSALVVSHRDGCQVGDSSPFSAGSSGIRPYNTACRTSQRCTAGRRCRSISHLSTASVGGPRQLEPSRRLGRSPAAKQLVTGLFDEVVSAHIAVSLPQLVPAFRATLPAERSGHALDNCGEHRCVLTNNIRMIPGDLT
jgi:hypothetical protein